MENEYKNTKIKAAVKLYCNADPMMAVVRSFEELEIRFLLVLYFKKCLTDEGRRAETFLLNFLDLREVLSSSPVYMQL